MLVCRFDMFHVELQRVKFDANERSYFLQGLLTAEPEQKKRYPYRYRRVHWGAVNTSEQVGKGGGHKVAYLYMAGDTGVGQGK